MPGGSSSGASSGVQVGGGEVSPSGNRPPTRQVDTKSFKRVAATSTNAALPSGAKTRSITCGSANSGTSSGSTAKRMRRPGVDVVIARLGAAGDHLLAVLERRHLIRAHGLLQAVVEAQEDVGLVAAPRRQQLEIEVVVSLA